MTFFLGLDLTFSVIRLDANGRWNLTDIHTASGVGSRTKQPNAFMRNQQPVDLIE